MRIEAIFILWVNVMQSVAFDDLLLTLDTDWAPDFAIDFVAEILKAAKVSATWFVTHQSPAIERLRNQPDLFELGIHPNFLAGSSHGRDTEEILRHCLEIVPTATSMRTHALVQSTPLLGQIITSTSITTDLSLFLPYMPNISPLEYYWQGRMLLRIPYFWEDDCEMERPKPSWELAPLLSLGEGIKVFDFHPIHIYLNSANMQPYQALKTSVGKLADATTAQTTPLIHQGLGTQTIFLALVKYLADNGKGKMIKEISSQWCSKGEER